jgi:integrase
LEAILQKLADHGHTDLVAAFAKGALPIKEIAGYVESGRLHELNARLREQDAPLPEAVHAALRAKAPDVKPSTLGRYGDGLAHFVRFAGEDATVRAALTTDGVQEFKAARLAEGAARETVNNDLQAVSVLASYALRKGWIDERPQVKRFKARVRIQYLTAAEIRPYFAAVRKPFRPIFELLLGTGMRLGEAEALRVCDLKLGDGEARALVNDAKTADGVRPVFVPPWVAETLCEQIEERALSGTDHLFTIKRRTIQKEHERACRIAGIPDYTIHDHRHTAAVHLAKAGMPLNLLQQQLGHARIDMTMRYARFHPEYSDVGGYFEEAGKRLGLTGAGNSLGNTRDTAIINAER